MKLAILSTTIAVAANSMAQSLVDRADALALCPAITARSVNRPNGAVIVGLWRAVVSPTAGAPAKAAQFDFRSDRTFVYTPSGQVQPKKGSYELQGAQVKLKVDEPDAEWPTEANLGTAGLTFNGLNYVRCPVIDIVGKWTLSILTGIDASTSATFSKDGTFFFKCSNATSKGRYSLSGSTIHLVWTEIDGAAVPQGSVKKALAVDDDGAGFKVDQFHYVKGA